MTTNRFSRPSPPPMPAGAAARAHTSDAIRRIDAMQGRAGAPPAPVTYSPLEEYRRAIDGLRRQLAPIRGSILHGELVSKVEAFLDVTDEHLRTGALRFSEQDRKP